MPGDRFPSAVTGAVTRTAALTRHNTALVLHDRGVLIGRIVLPLGFVVLMHPLYVAAQGAEGTVQAVCGGLVLFSLLALNIVGNAFLTERAWHTWNRLRSTPAHPVELFVGKAIPVFAALVVQQAVVLTFGVVAFGLAVADPALLVLAVVCWSFALLGIGAALGVLAPSFSALTTAYDVGGAVMGGVAGAVVPLAALPVWVSVIAPVSPGFWALGALRGALVGDTPSTVGACAVLIAIGLAGAGVVGLQISRAGARSAVL